MITHPITIMGMKLDIQHGNLLYDEATQGNWGILYDKEEPWCHIVVGKKKIAEFVSLEDAELICWLRNNAEHHLNYMKENIDIKKQLSKLIAEIAYLKNFEKKKT